MNTGSLVFSTGFALETITLPEQRPRELTYKIRVAEGSELIPLASLAPLEVCAFCLPNAN